MIVFARPCCGGATPPAWLPVFVGVAFIAYPFVVWQQGKGKEMTDGAIFGSFGIGAFFIVWGIYLWLHG